MEAETSAINQLIAMIDGCIRDAEAANLPEPAALLRMTKIDLITRANGISEEELELFLFVLESELRIAEFVTPPELVARRKLAEPA